MMSGTKVIHSIGISLLIAVSAFLYASVIQWMYGRYTSIESYYSHGFLIPFVSAFLIWQKRAQLQYMEPAGSWWGLLVVIAALLLHITGTIVYVYSVSGFSILLLIFGLSLFLFGRQITRSILFPLSFLFFMFPLPEAFISLISFPLKMFAADAGTWIVRLLGIPILQEGFNITIPNGKLLVGNPCSGLRSLITFLALGALYAYMSNLPQWRKWVLFSLSIPIALFSNITRIPILILVSHYWSLEAAAPDTLVHTGSGIFVFVLGFALLFLGAKVLSWQV
ncbi:MAG: exosortase/archaeosortase family protein [Lascolabacillus sp.]|jgi:exosortase A|nr:exosortase/archaeosortase family protein [Lascolabacillus sp.]